MRKKKQINENLINTNATIIQSAIRNKSARNAVLQQKQLKANEVVSNINKQRNTIDTKSLINKLNAIVMSNDMVNDLFEKPVDVVKRKVGRPRKHRRCIVIQLDALEKPLISSNYKNNDTISFKS